MYIRASHKGSCKGFSKAIKFACKETLVNMYFRTLWELIVVNLFFQLAGPIDNKPNIDKGEVLGSQMHIYNKNKLNSSDIYAWYVGRVKSKAGAWAGSKNLGESASLIYVGINELASKENPFRRQFSYRIRWRRWQICCMTFWEKTENGPILIFIQRLASACGYPRPRFSSR